LEGILEETCRRYFKARPLLVSAGVRTGLRILYDSPREVGVDRVADAVAAIKLYRPPLIVADLGTATVFDGITREGDYLGGAIAPGLMIGAEALVRRADRLHRVELQPPALAIGRNTEAALQAGIVFGHVSLIEGMVARFKAELGDDAQVVATGGYAELMARLTTVIGHVNPNLTLHGLQIIYDLNRKRDD
jgi:type III pantothenate kinase